jgi:hypothetical protein
MIVACGWWPSREVSGGSARSLERLSWRRIWLPLLPAMIVAAWLSGWALAEPEPHSRESIDALNIGQRPVRAAFRASRHSGGLVVASR